MAFLHSTGFYCAANCAIKWVRPTVVIILIGYLAMSFAGGYDEGYRNCDCFWGTEPGSLIKLFLKRNASLQGTTALDLGCGEGKNSAALSIAGSTVTAVDCSAVALANGKRHFGSQLIRWHLSDAERFLRECNEQFDIVVMYGLLHCLPSIDEISTVIRLALDRTIKGGHHFVVAFNAGPHDLTAHPGFSPTLLPHNDYLRQYEHQEILSQSNSVIHETHPHNNIPHFHSLTRLVARKAR